MPTVPVFKPNTNLAGVPGVRQQDSATPETFGAGVGQATTRVGGELAQLGGELSQLGAQIQQRQDAVAAKDAYQKASEQVMTLMHDPGTGILARRGSQARGLTNQATKELERIQGEVTKRLTPAQRSMFDSFWAGTRQSSVVSAARHEADQIRATEDQTNDAIIDNASAAVAANPYDQKTIDHHIQVGLSTLASKYRGASEEVYRNAVMEFKTKAYMGAIIKRMDKDPAGAAQMLKDHNSEMDPRLTEKLQAQVDHQDAVLFAQKTGDEMMMKYPNPEDEEKAMAQVRDMGLDPTKRQLVETRVQAMFADKRRFEQEKLQARVEQVTGTVFSAPSMTAGRQIVDGITDLKVRAQAEQAFRIRFAEDLQVQAQARSIALSEAAAKRSEGRQAKKFEEYQTAYEAIPAAVRSDPTKVLELIRKNYSGVEEENFARYALGRMQEEKPKTAKATLRDQVIRENARQYVIEEIQKRIDISRRSGTPATAGQVQAWVTSQEFAAGDGMPMVDEAAVKDLVKYAAGQGNYGETPRNKVDAAIRSLGIKDNAGKMKSIDDFPGVYEMVLERLEPGKKPTDLDLERITKSILQTRVGTTPGWWGRNPATAYEALKAGTKFTADVDAKDAQFLKTFADLIPALYPQFTEVRLSPEQKQEFVDQVMIPELTTAQERATIFGETFNMRAVQDFYMWVKRVNPKLISGNPDPEKIQGAYKLYLEGFNK